MAAETFPPPPNGILILSQTGIDHFALGMITERTFHFVRLWKVKVRVVFLISTFYLLPSTLLFLLNFSILIPDSFNISLGQSIGIAVLIDNPLNSGIDDHL